MRGHCKRFGSEMCDFSALSTEKQELVKMFVEYLHSDKHKKVGREHGHGHHGKFGRFGKHGHGKHHGHGMHFGRHGPHGHCGKHRHRGPQGHSGPHGHGRPHCHRGRHGLHGKHGKFWAKWSNDLTNDDSDDSRAMLESGRNQSPPPGETANQEQEAEANTANCKCSRFGRTHGGRFGKWKLHKRNVVEMVESSSQTEDNTEETQDNLTEMVENINIENTE